MKVGTGNSNRESMMKMGTGTRMMKIRQRNQGQQGHSLYSLGLISQEEYKIRWRGQQGHNMYALCLGLWMLQMSLGSGQIATTTPSAGCGIGQPESGGAASSHEQVVIIV